MRYRLITFSDGQQTVLQDMPEMGITVQVDRDDATTTGDEVVDISPEQFAEAKHKLRTFTGRFDIIKKRLTYKPKLKD